MKTSFIKDIWNNIKCFFLLVSKYWKISTFAVDKFLSFIGEKFLYYFKKVDTYIYLIAVIVLALIARSYMLDFISGDVRSFIKNWYSVIYNQGIYTALGQSIGDYTPAYLYILSFISLFRIDPESIRFIHAVKYVSIFFDLLTAVYSYLIIYKITKNKSYGILGAGLFLFLPTVMLNSSMWGQCDSIYACFILMSIYYLLGNHQRTSLIMYGISFAFKLQAIFVLPIYLILMLRGKVKFRYFLWLPLVYIIFAIPSACCGRSFGEIMKIYFNQSGSYAFLTLNAPTIYMFIANNFVQTEQNDLMLGAATLFALFVLGTTLFFIYKKELELDVKNIVKVAYLFSLLAPFVLPRMHERYFYLSEMLAVIYFVLNMKKCYIPLLGLFGTITGYNRYLLGVTWLDANTTLRIGATFIAAALVLLFIDVFKSDKAKEKQVELTC